MVDASSETYIKRLLPDEALIEQCRKRYGLSIESVFLSEPPIGGDLWGVLPVDDHKFSFFCLDVCGHGAEAAPHTRYVYDLLHSPSLSISEPAAVLHFLNVQLHAFLPRGRFVAIWYGVIDVYENTLSWAASTFMPPLYCKDAASGFGLLPGEGLPLGFREDSDYVVHHRPFSPGARLILYSDAMVETPLPPESVFTTQTLCEFVNAQSVDSSAQSVTGAIIERLDLQKNRLSDDLTMVALFRT